MTPQQSWLKKQFAKKGKRTYWNGERAHCAVVRVIVGEVPSGWWCEQLTGTEREAVRVEYGESRFYLDNEAYETDLAGSGWKKVTVGRGSPRYPHRSLPVEREVSNG